MYNCVRYNTLLIQIGVKIVWDNEWIDLGTRIWHPLQILQGRMTSSPTWQRSESLGSRSSNALPKLWLLLLQAHCNLLTEYWNKCDGIFFQPGEWMRMMYYSRKWHRHTRKKENRLLLSGVEPKTFRLLVRMLYHWATGDPWELRPLN